MRTTFLAPWSKGLKISTLIVLLLPPVQAVTMFLVPAPVWTKWLVVGLTILILAACVPFAVRGYEITPDGVRVQRLGWSSWIRLNGLREARVEPQASAGSIRVCGMGGFLCHCGWFRNKRLGNYRAYMTDPGRAVVLDYADGKYVVTPDDPEAFAAEVRRRRGLPESES